MPDRRAVMMVLYDLPVESSEQRRKARLFRKGLNAHGYIPLQKSVYVKLIHNDQAYGSEIAGLQSITPGTGTVNTLFLSLNLFRDLRTLQGEKFQFDTFAGDMVKV